MLKGKARPENMRNWLVLVLVLTGIDQVSKYIAQATLTFAEPVPVIPFFNFMLVYNTGAAFSFLSDAGGWQRWFFVALALAVCVYILVWLRSLDKKQLLLGVGLSFILGGALGNLIDRIIHGKVTDFIDFFYPSQGECIFFFFQLPANTCHWPTFNIADMLITMGAGILFLQLLRESRS